MATLYAKEMGGRGIVVVMHFCSWLLVFFWFWVASLT